jgi:tetratricopeptide (TPR) repeat protein
LALHQTMRFIIITLLLSVGLAGRSFSQSINVGEVKADTVDVASTLLINDIKVQLDATEALNNMYNFNFATAEKQFRWLKQKYGWHPLPYFLMGLSEWWKIVPHVENEQYDKKFYAYMDTALVLSERLYKEVNKVEGAFFLSATYSFQGRLLSERKKWTKAAVAGKNALAYLEECRGQEDLSPEILFGDALYNYYSVWVPENYPLLKPIMLFFDKGDKDDGIKQLKEVSRNAFYTRTEAQYFLMRILSSEGKNMYEALQVAEYLHQTFPDNPYFHRYYSRLLYGTGDYQLCEKTSLEIIDKYYQRYDGYEENSGRYAAFFLGQIYQTRKDYTNAKKFYKEAVRFSSKNETQQMGYNLYSLLALGEIAEKENNQKEAKEYYKEVKRLAGRKDRAWEVAKKNLKEMD